MTIVEAGVKIRLAAATMLLGCSAPAWSRADADQLRHSEMALKDEAGRLGGQILCSRVLYKLPVSQVDQRRLEDFRLSLAALMTDYSDRVEAHAARFADATSPSRARPLLRFHAWRMVSAEIERQQSLPTDPSICGIIASSALSIAEEKGLRRSTTLTRGR